MLTRRGKAIKKLSPPHLLHMIHSRTTSSLASMMKLSIQASLCTSGFLQSWITASPCAWLVCNKYILKE